MNIDRSGLDLGAFNQELFIFHTGDDPVNGKWLPHTANPVMVDARRGRMGGAFFRTNEGHIIRSAQSGGLTYGCGLKFLRIEKLTTDEYQETLLDEVYPNWLPGGLGIHHSHRMENVSVLDVLLRVPRFRMKS